jgi:O-antigen/teichoic acid export membrane protein
MKVAKRVVYNTGYLYIKLLIGLIIGLFTTRLVLQALGEERFGVFALVGGTIGVLDLLKSSMSNASMRFLSHSLGSGDKSNMIRTFNTTLFIHFCIGILTIIIMEAGGWLMFEYLLIIPENLYADARLIFHFLVLTTFISIISVPYDAVMNSHENILALSLADMFGYILKLGVAIYITYSSGNLLVIYGLCILLIEVILRIVKQWYSRSKYEECKIGFRKYVDRDILKNILSFTGWNVFGTVASMSVNHIRGIILNMFFGVSLNAAFGISKRASAPVNLVSASMTRALNPQLVKSEGAGDRVRMLYITETATKFSVFLFGLIAIPVIFEAEYLLNIWLKHVPNYAVIFTQLLLTGLLIEKFSFEITSALRAVGKIRNFQIMETSLAVLNIPLAYFVLSAGFQPYSILFIGLFLGLLGFASRLYFGKRDAELHIGSFFKNGIFPVLWPLLLSVGVAFSVHFLLDPGFLRLLVSFILSSGIFILIFLKWGVKKQEKEKLLAIFPFFKK